MEEPNATSNRFRNEGVDIYDAAIFAGKKRFRAVILTSLTTFGGLTPMIFETSVQARTLIPMAVSLGFGILFSTFITLFLVPALFMMVERGRAVWRGDRVPVARNEGRTASSVGEVL